MVFAARIGSDSGYGVPSDVIERELGRAGAAVVSTDGCPG
jgi:hypothetical protein